MVTGDDGDSSHGEDGDDVGEIVVVPCDDGDSGSH